MDYRYLETTGALNDAGSGTGSRARASSRASSARGRAGKRQPNWRGKPISRAVLGAVPESVARADLIFPVGEEGEILTLAAVDHGNVILADKMSFLLAPSTGCRLDGVLDSVSRRPCDRASRAAGKRDPCPPRSVASGGRVPSQIRGTRPIDGTCRVRE